MRVPQVVSQAEELRNKEGKLEEALELLVKYEKTSPKEDLPFVQHAIATLLHDTGKFQESLEQFEFTIKTSKENKNLLVETESLHRIGWGLWMIRNSDKKAVEYWDRAWKIVEKNLEDEDFQKVGSNIWAARGAAYYESEEYEEALNSYKKAMELAKKCEFHERVCTLKGDIANVFIAQNRYDEARLELEEVYDIAKVSYRHSVPASLIRLARLYSLDDYEKNDLKKAKSLLTEALKVTQTEKWRRDEAEVYDAFFRLYLVTDEIEKADLNSKLAVEIYKELGMKSRIENLERSN